MLGSLHFIVALLLALMAGIPPDEGQDWIRPVAFLAMSTVVMVVVMAILTSSGGDPRDVARRAERLGETAVVGVFAFGVFWADLPWLVHHVLGVPEPWVPLALLVPVAAWSLLVWQASARRMQMEGALEDPIPAYLLGKLRLGLLNLAPYALLTAIFTLATAVWPEFAAWVSNYWWAQYMALVLIVVAAAWLSPLVFRVLLPVTRMRDGPVHGLLTSVAVKARQPVDSIYLWDTKGLRIANAFFTGLGWPFRSVFISSELLNRLSPGDVEAVMAHELGHARHRHLWVMLAFLLTMPLLATAIAVLVSPGLNGMEPCPVDPTAYDPARHADETGSFIVLMAVLAWLAVGFGYLSRRLEREADEFAAKVVGTEPMCSALYSLGRQRPSSYFRAGWRHFSIAQRIRELVIRERAEFDPAARRLVLRWALERRVAIAGSMLALVATVAFHAPTVRGQWEDSAWHIPVVMAEAKRLEGSADWREHLVRADSVLSAELEKILSRDSPVSQDSVEAVVLPLWGVRAMQERKAETLVDLMAARITNTALRDIDAQKLIQKSVRLTAAISAAIDNRTPIAYEWEILIQRENERRMREPKT